MSYDEVDIEDMDWDEAALAYTYQCPCGDLFQITLDELRKGEEIARCPSCSLYVCVVYDPAELERRHPATVVAGGGGAGGAPAAAVAAGA